MQRRNVTRDNIVNMTRIREDQVHRVTPDTKPLMLIIRVTKHILTFVVVQKRSANEAVHGTAQSTALVLISRTIACEMQTLPWDDGAHCRASVETPSLPSKRTSMRVCHTLVADRLYVHETSN